MTSSPAPLGRPRRMNAFGRLPLSGGASVAAMAEQIKRSKAAVRSRASLLKISVAKSRKLRLKAKAK
jgi:hypothetical protein